MNEILRKEGFDAFAETECLRFYKSAANIGSHVGNLWSTAGTLLATVTFSGETASGWQQANFRTPVLISPSLLLPVVAGRVALGTWQSVVLIDFNRDNPERRVRLSFLPG